MRTWFIVAAAVFCLAGCGKQKPDRPPEAEGRALALTHCSSCHAFPEPSLLAKQTWMEQTLPQMGPRLGINSHAGRSYPSDRELPEVSDLFPASPMLSSEQWQAILDYYKDAAPEAAVKQKRTAEITADLTLFEPVPAPRSPGSPAPMTTCVRIDPGNHQLWSGDAAGRALVLRDASLRTLTTLPAGGVIVEAGGDFSRPGPHDFSLTLIGSLHPADTQNGSLVTGRMGEDAQLLDGFNPVLDGLRRPVQITACALGGSGKPGWLVCGFGHLKGDLTWHPAGEKPLTLLPLAGCVRSIVEDVNADGLPDLWALFAQGRESLTLFTNKGGGQWSPREVRSFPAVHGSSFFDLTDLDGDGRRDLLFCCGDNADYSVSLKAWHGIYLCLNDGAGGFREHTFFPLHGCSKAVAQDFDLDGDHDIAAISFFPDFKVQPHEGFVYLENTGGLQFRARTLSAAATAGRWLVMDAGDLDGDGDADLALGNFTFAATAAPDAVQRHIEAGPEVIVMRNRTR